MDERLTARRNHPSLLCVLISFLSRINPNLMRSLFGTPRRCSLPVGCPSRKSCNVSHNLSGGSDTVLAAVYTFILAMLCHPDKQTKIQEELDRVIGHDRLPDYNDEPNLPYLSAAIKEAFRWD